MTGLEPPVPAPWKVAEESGERPPGLPILLVDHSEEELVLIQVIQTISCFPPSCNSLLLPVPPEGIKMYRVKSGA